MNFASWVILGIVLVVIGLAIRSVFFKKAAKRGCCDVRFENDVQPRDAALARCDESGSGAGTAGAGVTASAKSAACPGCSLGPGCAACPECGGAVVRNALQPVILEGIPDSQR